MGGGRCLFLGEPLLWALIVKWLLQLILMFEGISVVTAHAGFTSGSWSSYKDNWVTVDFVDSLEYAQDLLFPRSKLRSTLFPEQPLKSSKSEAEAAFSYRFAEAASFISLSKHLQSNDKSIIRPLTSRLITSLFLIAEDLSFQTGETSFQRCLVNNKVNLLTKPTIDRLERETIQHN